MLSPPISGFYIVQKEVGGRTTGEKMVRVGPPLAEWARDVILDLLLFYFYSGHNKDNIIVLLSLCCCSYPKRLGSRALSWRSVISFTIKIILL